MSQPFDNRVRQFGSGAGIAQVITLASAYPGDFAFTEPLNNLLDGQSVRYVRTSLDQSTLVELSSGTLDKVLGTITPTTFLIALANGVAQNTPIDWAVGPSVILNCPFSEDIGAGGVTSITGTANQIAASASTGDVVLSLANNVVRYECFTGITPGATLTVPNLTQISYYQVPAFISAITLNWPTSVERGVLLKVDNTLNPDNSLTGDGGSIYVAGGGITDFLYNGTAWVP